MVVKVAAIRVQELRIYGYGLPGVGKFIACLVMTVAGASRGADGIPGIRTAELLLSGFVGNF